jgi:hypothetical protein
MMDKRLVLLPLALLAGTSLSGCVAVAIPALAGSAMVGSRVIDRDEAPEPQVAAAPVPAPAPAPVIKPVPVPTVSVATGTTIVPPPASTPAAAPPRIAVVTPAPAPAPAIIVPPPSPAPVRTPPPPAAAAPVAVAAAPIAVPPPVTSYPDPDRPLTPGQSTFARFVRYIDASARGAVGGADLNSAMLSDPIALDGKRRRCAVGEQLVALIDLDPTGGLFAPPATPEKQPGLALGLAMLRTAGVEIAWMSDLPVSQSGALRTALEGSGLDPRGQDIISLRRDEADTKQQRRDNLAGITCIVAIAGDERPDFDERFKYLRNPEAGAGIEPLIGDGWFLIEPLLGK